MCFEFATCFGGGRTDDYGGERPNRKEEHGGGRRCRADGRGNRERAYNGGAAEHRPAPHEPYHHELPSSVDEAGHKAYHDGAVGRGRYGAYGQHKTNIATPKLPAWQNKVGDGAYTAGLQEAAADHMKNATMDYHHYPTTTTTITTLGRY